MGKGFSGVRGAVQDVENRKNSGGGGGKLWFRLDDGEAAIVRFLEEGEDVTWAWVHEIPNPTRGYPDVYNCRAYNDDGEYTNEECPGCDDGLKRKFRGAINLIWRDGPIFERDAENKLVKTNGRVNVVGNEDQVGLWVSGIIVFDELSELDSTYRGLTSRDFRVRRQGTGLNTKYKIQPADPDQGAVAMSGKDEELAENKYDLSEYVLRQDLASWGKKKAPQAAPVVPTSTSPFRKKRDEDE